jgi:hypothetical protein
MILLSILFALSIIGNGVLLWYCRKLVSKLWLSVQGIDQLQELLEEYNNSLAAIYQLEELYGEEAIKSTIANTKMVAEACKFFKTSVVGNDDNEEKENNRGGSEAQKEEKNGQKTVFSVLH